MKDKNWSKIAFIYQSEEKRAKLILDNPTTRSEVIEEFKRLLDIAGFNSEDLFDEV